VSHIMTVASATDVHWFWTGTTDPNHIRS